MVRDPEPPRLARLFFRLVAVGRARPEAEADLAELFGARAAARRIANARPR
jgi:hypothetical protein